MSTSTARILLAHGAGAPSSSPFMEAFKASLESMGIAVSLFNFEYMQHVVETGKKRPPPAVRKLVEEYRQQVLQAPADLPLFIGGKSMGGRVSTMFLAEPDCPDHIQGGVVLGYPFHPPGKPDKLRVDHLTDIAVPLLICQGERDTFGAASFAQALLQQITPLSDTVSLYSVSSGDHSFKPRKSDKASLEGNINEAALHILNFIKECLK